MEGGPLKTEREKERERERESLTAVSEDDTKSDDYQWYSSLFVLF